MKCLPFVAVSFFINEGLEGRAVLCFIFSELHNKTPSV